MRRFVNASSLTALGFACALVAATNWGLSTAKTHFDQSVRHDLAAAATLSKVQVSGERLRRFEKEVFIHVGDPAKRTGHLKEFDETYQKLLWDLDTALLPTGKAFTAQERESLAKWKLDAIFYYGQFQTLANRASQMDMSGLTEVDKGRLTIEFNGEITNGKNRFRELLAGTDKLRIEKETHSQAVAADVDRVFVRAAWLVTLLSVVGCITVPLMVRRGRRVAPAKPRPTDATGAAGAADAADGREGRHTSPRPVFAAD